MNYLKLLENFKDELKDDLEVKIQEIQMRRTGEKRYALFIPANDAREITASSLLHSLLNGMIANFCPVTGDQVSYTASLITNDLTNTSIFRIDLKIQKGYK